MASNKYLDYAGLQEVVTKIKALINDIGHITFKGSVATVAALPALNDVTDGWMYMITTADVTTSDFIEGAGVAFNANTEVVKITSGGNARWCLLGTIFNVDDRLQFGSIMPTAPAANQVFLYLGDTTYTYTSVTPEGTENPAALGWYHSTDSGATWSLATETTVDTETYVYATRSEEYVQGVIYKWSGTAWIALSSGDTFVAITTAEIDAMFE